MGSGPYERSIPSSGARNKVLPLGNGQELAESVMNSPGYQTQIDRLTVVTLTLVIPISTGYLTHSATLVLCPTGITNLFYVSLVQPTIKAKIFLIRLNTSSTGSQSMIHILLECTLFTTHCRKPNQPTFSKIYNAPLGNSCLNPPPGVVLDYRVRCQHTGGVL